ncbi:F-box domain-containing protein [Madurella fahalii]|uniref:F-box domain-containing protein n=1 Tax=Madurella fahalii TaxID=1157608 RepID=A0ABQ0FXJ1_9PEZI
MTSNNGTYSSSPPLAKQPLEARSSSVSSTASATSYLTPFSAPHTIYGPSSRSLSPASGIFDSGSGAAFFARNHCQDTVQEQSHASQAQPTSLVPNPTHYLQSHVSPSLPLYSPVPVPRQFARSTSYSYQLGSVPQQPSPLAYQTYPAMYPSFSTNPYHSSPAMPSYQIPQLVHSSSMLARSETPGESLLLKMLRNLPLDVIREIQRYVGWFQCWKLYRVNRWFRDNFHPSKLPENDKISGVLYTEQCYGRYDESSSSSSSASSTANSPPRRNESKSPKWFGCYHCFAIKDFEHFERFTWTNAPEDAGSKGPEEESTEAAVTRPLLPPPLPAPTVATTLPSSATSNPHYCPGLTRSSLTAAAGNGHRSSASKAANSTTNGSGGGRSLSPSHPPSRILATWGVRRFCIDCGVKKRFYRPGDVIELHKPVNSKEALWVCGCWKLHWRRPLDLKCVACGWHVPLSTPTGRR